MLGKRKSSDPANLEAQSMNTKVLDQYDGCAKNIPQSSPGPRTGKGLKDYQKEALTKYLFTEHNLTALERARKRHDPTITEQDLLDLSSLDHLYERQGPCIWKNVLTGDEALSRARPVQGSGMINADDMGLGKSAPTIALIEATAKEARQWAREDESEMDEAEKVKWILPHGRQAEDYYFEEPPSDDPPRKKKLHSSSEPDEGKQTAGGGKIHPGRVRRDQVAEKKEPDPFCFRTAATLIVCPKSVLEIWKGHFDKHWNGLIRDRFPADREKSSTLVLFDHRQGRENASVERFKKSTVVITTYDAMMADFREGDGLYRMVFFRVVFDEGHALCNMRTQTFNAASKLHRLHVHILTGTPVQNYVRDVCAYAFLLRLPEGLGDPDSDDFLESCVWPVALSKDALKAGTEPDWTYMQAFARIFSLRRLKIDLLRDDLPPKTVKAFYVDSTVDQKRLHDEELLEHTWAKIARQRRIAGNLDARDWYRDFMLRREEWKDGRMACDPNQLASKIDWLRSFAENREGKIVVFSQWVRALNRVKNLMRSLDYKVMRLQGSVDIEDRPEIARRFNTFRSNKVCLLASIGAVGEGIDLTGGQTCIFIDMCWNPSKHGQAMDRLHRLGQKQEVTVYMPITKNTIEEDVWFKQQVKREFYHKIWPNDPPGQLEMCITHEVLLDFMSRMAPQAKRVQDEGSVEEHDVLDEEGEEIEANDDEAEDSTYGDEDDSMSDDDSYDDDTDEEENGIIDESEEEVEEENEDEEDKEEEDDDDGSETDD